MRVTARERADEDQVGDCAAPLQAERSVLKSPSCSLYFKRVK
jgi:hypothetical protein